MLTPAPHMQPAAFILLLTPEVPLPGCPSPSPRFPSQAAPAQESPPLAAGVPMPPAAGVHSAKANEKVKFNEKELGKVPSLVPSSLVPRHDPAVPTLGPLDDDDSKEGLGSQSDAEGAAEGQAQVPPQLRGSCLALCRACGISRGRARMVMGGEGWRRESRLGCVIIWCWCMHRVAAI